VGISGRGYPPDSLVELVWYTVVGTYELDGDTEFLGQRYDESQGVLASLRADAQGDIEGSVSVPLDFGGPHDVRGRVDSRELSQASLTILPSIFMEPLDGPVGTPIEVTIAGIDWRPNVCTWHVLYDNRYLGCMSAVTTRGLGVARFRAAGGPGLHLITVVRNSQISAPYLAIERGVFRDTPGAGTEFVFQVTSEQAPGCWIEDFYEHDAPWPSMRQGPAALTLSPDRGQAGQPVALHGRGLAPDRSLEVRWTTTTGDRVTGRGISHEIRTLGSARTNPSGELDFNFEIPDDLGGQHCVEVVNGEQVVGAAGMVVLPRLVACEPRQVRWGEKVHIQVKGLGWTTYDNTYAVTYDNAFIGYVCGFSTGGDVTFSVTAAGAPGIHLVDLYPMIYKARDFNRMPRGGLGVPQLTYATDHPRRTTPAVRMAYELVP
jgi:hypothetical protein